MKFVVVEKLPDIDKDFSNAATKKKMKDYLDEFMKMNVKIVRVEYYSDEYKNIESAHVGFTKAAKRAGYPINACRRNGDLYLVRRDI